MEFTRRVLVSGGLATPLVAKLSGEAIAEPGAPAVDLPFTILDGFTELRLTQRMLDSLCPQNIVVFAIEPSTVVNGADGSTVEGVRMPTECGTLSMPVGIGRPASAIGRGKGGIGMRNDKASIEFHAMRTDLTEGRAYAFVKVGDEWMGEQPVFVTDPEQLTLTLQPGVLDKPGTVKGADIRLSPTQEWLDVFQRAFGPPPFTMTDVLAIAGGEGRIWPLPPVSP